MLGKNGAGKKGGLTPEVRFDLQENEQNREKPALSAAFWEYLCTQGFAEDLGNRLACTTLMPGLAGCADADPGAKAHADTVFVPVEAAYFPSSRNDTSNKKTETAGQSHQPSTF